MRLLITGTAGFIGSNLIRYLLANVADLKIVSLDSLAYSGSRINIETIPGGIESDRHHFIRGSIADTALIDEIAAGELDGIINLAAHTHVDRALYRPEVFIKNNVEGVLNLLCAAGKFKTGRLLQVSTDEVYGAVRTDAPCDENAPLRPGNYYASSKAAADLYISAALNFGNVDAVIIRGTNNFGPRQYPEKLIPFFTHRILMGQTVPLYGNGRQMRDWLHVEDFCRAIWLVFTKGKCGQIYNAGAGNHISNYDLTKKIVSLLGAEEKLIKNVADRPGHDFCYAVNWEKIRALGWEPRANFEKALAETVNWYRENQAWVAAVLTEAKADAEDSTFFGEHYKNRV